MKIKEIVGLILSIAIFLFGAYRFIATEYKNGYFTMIVGGLFLIIVI